VIRRDITLTSSSPLLSPIVLTLGDGGPPPLSLKPRGGGEIRTTLLHRIQSSDGDTRVVHGWLEGKREGWRTMSLWSGLTRIQLPDPELTHLFRAARHQLPTAVDHTGRMDGSIWQYNLEWVRDQSHVAEALVRLGDYEKARTLLVRLLDDFVSPEGDTIDSGRRRPAQDVELDQNGEILEALGTYAAWTGDLEMVEDRWDRIRSLADFPFQDRFLHVESGLLHNRREYWERHGGHGIQDGFELMSQFFVAQGLGSASRLAEALGEEEDRALWAERARGLKDAILHNPIYGLVEEGHLIKRRGVGGEWQKTVEIQDPTGLPEGIPILRPGPHFLDPDASSALPVAYEFMDPQGDIARKSLEKLEELWNQEWEGGGYGRYHASSEPDSPGAWPFASLFVARAYAEARDSEKVLRILRWLRSTQGGHSGTWFENDGPRIAPPYPQVGVTPWTWAEMVTLFVHHLLGVRPHMNRLTLRPWLPHGIDEAQAEILVRGHRVGLHLRRAPSPQDRGATVADVRLPWSEGGVHLPLPTAETRVELHF
jgi:hypothetical protein